MRRVPVSLSLLLPLLVAGACQPAGDLAVAEQQEAQLLRPPPDDDPPRLDGPITPLPRNLHVTSNVGGVVIQLDFDCGGNAELHEIFHQADGGAWTKIDEGCVEDGPERGHIYDNHGIQPLHNYCYKVKASNLDHNATSDVRCVTADQWRMPPVLPQLSLGEIRREYITIKVADKSVTEKGFHLLRRIKGSNAPFVSVAEFDARIGNNITIVHRDETISLGNTYEYKVNVFDTFGNNADTPVIEARAFPKVPEAPSSILFDGRSPNSVKVHWFSSGDVVDTYYVDVTGPTSSSVHVSGTTFERTLTSLSAGAHYCVAIHAENVSGVGPTRLECVYTLAPPPLAIPLDEFDLKVDPPVVTRIHDGDDHTTATYGFSFKVCNVVASNHATAPFYRVSAAVGGLELTLDHAAQPLAPGACDWFSASQGVWSGLNDVTVSVQATSGLDGYTANDGNNRVFLVPLSGSTSN